MTASGCLLPPSTCPQQLRHPHGLSGLYEVRQLSPYRASESIAPGAARQMTPQVSTPFSLEHLRETHSLNPLSRNSIILPLLPTLICTHNAVVQYHKSDDFGIICNANISSKRTVPRDPALTLYGSIARNMGITADPDVP